MARSIVNTLQASAGGLLLLAALGSTGCQSSYSGQTLPSPYWLTDDVQYFPPGPEFKLSKEAAAMKVNGGARRGPAVPIGPVGPPVDPLVPGAVPVAPLPGAPAPADPLDGNPAAVDPGAPDAAPAPDGGADPFGAP